jgi:L-histidine Nalpha-methyltransferase
MFDAPLAPSELAAEILDGLRHRPRQLPPKLFYDEEGVRLFGEITGLPEYYLTRTELALLDAQAETIARGIRPGSVLVEYGASEEGKALRLLRAARDRIQAYVPIDVAEPALEAMRARLARALPALQVHPVAADFLRPLCLPPAVEGLSRLGFFPGSTIGNLEPEAAAGFLRHARRTLGPGAAMLLGADLCRDPAVLIPAYDDAAGVTAAFNLNLLRRLNREFGADFDLAAFRHEARWNAAASRIEMHLRSMRAQTVRILGERIPLEEGETIHTENSHKYDLPALGALAERGGWSVRGGWNDPAGRFALLRLEADA